MRIRMIHSWDVAPREAVAIQQRLRGRVRPDGALGAVRHVAGADISCERHSPLAWAGVVVLGVPGLEEVERVWAEGELAFPYVPGLLSFREGPLLLEAFRKLRTEPDVVFFDGQGIAHPRRFGIASHLGLFLDRPTIGCAKSRLTGTWRSEPGGRRGCRRLLRDGDETIGAVVRTRDGVKPVFISVGHRLGLDEAVRLTLRCCDGYRVPKPTRVADHFVGELRRRHRRRASAT
jgi:deoxyribonuclease V